MRSVLNLLVACAALLAATVSSAQEPARLALLIGNKTYRPAVGPLKNPHNDIDIVGKALAKVGFQVLTPNKDATREQTLFAVHDFAEKLKAAGPDAVGFLHYSGHGVAAGGQNYLIPVDVEQPTGRILAVKGVTHAEVLNTLQEIAPQAAHYLVVDACRNTLGGWKGSKGFVPEQRRSGVMIAFAAAPGTTASDEGDYGGPYAAALAAELIKPGQNDLLMFHNVRVAVDRTTRGDQVPWVEDGIRRPERVLFGGVAAKPPQSPPVPAPAPTAYRLSEAAEAWNVIKDTNSTIHLEAFIRRFGDTFYGDLAKARLAELKQAEADKKKSDDEARAKAEAERRRLAMLQQQEEERKRAEADAAKKRAEAADASRPGRVFRDCSDCPEMVVVPAGEFTMGSPADEAERSSDEGPQRKVRIANPFAVGKFEVTFAEWDACVAESRCTHKPTDEGWGRGRRPVIRVSWDDAQTYIAWLSRKTGKTYRLLSEAEWEYAARAGTTTPFSTGRTITTAQGNFDGNYTYGGSAKGVYRLQTVEVGSFPENKFGLHDVHGNVWEWVEDCYQDSYQGAPTDGSATTTSSCKARVLRGGAWNNSSWDLRSAERLWLSPGIRNYVVGFRLARAL